MERKFKYNRMKQTVLLLRPYQWVKNAFCFLPLFFDRHILDMEYLFLCIIAFVGYCFAASGIYCFNDISEYKDAGYIKIEPKRDRKLLLTKKELRKPVLRFVIVSIVIMSHL